VEARGDDEVEWKEGVFSSMLLYTRQLWLLWHLFSLFVLDTQLVGGNAFLTTISSLGSPSLCSQSRPSEARVVRL
jgi:hypothetical protein